MDESEVYKFLMEYFRDREGDSILNVIEELDLIESGLLDSLDVISLSIKLEERFDVKLNFSEAKTFEKMRRINSIVGMIAR